MCGIAGIYNSSRFLTLNESSLSLDSIYHRGPDAQKIYFDNICVLGSTRLNILDPNGGKQPFIYNDRFILVFNGQIYNHLVLRKKMKNFKWNTRSDTETVIQLLINFGPKILNEFEGMFALAFYDNNKKELIIARDKIGEKPLFYYKNSNEFTFGSTTEVISKNLNCYLDLDYKALLTMLNTGFIPPNRSVYLNIQPVLPGYYIKLNQKSFEIIQYQIKNTEIQNHDFSAKLLSDLIQESVDSQCSADVDVGLFLSGGLDSSMLAYAMKQRLGNFKSFCVDFGTNQEDIESAIRITKELSTELVIVKLGDDINSLVESNAHFFDEPFGDSASIPLSALSLVAKKEVGVCISGDGSDELFGGYDFRYRPLVIDPLPIARLTDNFIIETFFRLLNKFGFKKLRQDYQDRKLNFKYRQSKDVLSLFINLNYNLNSKNFVLESMDLDKFSSTYKDDDLINKILEFEQNFYLQGDILVKTDRTTMAHSLEARTPYLSSKIIDFANSLHAKEKISKYGNKIVLNKAFHHKTGRPFLRKDKMGMGLPMKFWMQSNEIQKKLTYLKTKNFYRTICEESDADFLEINSKLNSQFSWNLLNVLSWAEAKGKND
jgi:asparagine synthase (glutamine-hydrolysing)